MAVRLRNVRGVRRMALGAALGAVAALAFEPFRMVPLLLVSYAALILLLDGAATQRRRFRAAAAIGWSYGFGFFLVGLHWVGYAFLVDREAHAWLLPVVAAIFPGGLALFFAFTAIICVWRWPDGTRRIFLFALVLGAMEWIRGHIFTGFPWNLPAYGWAASDAILQSVSVFGVYGLSVLTILFGASLALLADGRRQTRRVPLMLTALFVLVWAAGSLRLVNAETGTAPGVTLRIVQPATSQTEKYDPRYTERNWRRLIDLTAAPGARPPTHIIWPEAAPPFTLVRSQAALADIAALIGPDQTLLTGAVRIEEPQGGPPRYFNSFYVFAAGGRLLATYDKFHLVPFGEYLPFAATLNALGITQIGGGPGGFSSGDGPHTLAVPGAPDIGPLICYEVIFPRAVTATPRPKWFVNVTDDSWFGPAAGPRQHLLIARTRAIEEGVPIARAANSGISAIIDAYGRVRAQLSLGERGAVDGALPLALATTTFVRYGNAILVLIFLSCALACFLPRRMRGT